MKSTMDQQIVRILLVEDNAGDVFLVRRALETQGLKFDVVLAKNGEEAMRLLEPCQGDYVPELILLDINLPRVDGSRILSHIRGTDAFAETAVIVLTSSS